MLLGVSGQGHAVTHEIYTNCSDVYTVTSPTNPGAARSGTLNVRPGDRFRFTLVGWTDFNQNGGFGVDYCYYHVLANAGVYGS